MATVAELITRLGFSVDMTGLDRYRRATERMGMYALNYWSRIGQQAFAGFLTEAVNQFGKLEQQLQAVKAVSEDLTPTGMQELAKMAQDLSTKSKYSSIQIAEGMQVLAKAGLNTKGIKSAIEVVNDLSVAADIGQERASEFMVGVMNTFGRDLESKQAWVKTANTLAVGANESAISLKDMVYSFKYAGPAARAFGVDVEEVTKYLALMGDAGIKGSTAGTTLRATFLRLAKQPKEAREALQKYGISITDGNKRIKPLLTILDELKIKLKNVTQQERLSAISKIFNTTATSGIMALMNSEIKRRDELDQKIKSNTNALNYMKDQMNKGVIPATQRLKNSWGAFLQTVGARLAPIVEKVANKLNSMLNSFRALNPYVQELVLMLAGLGLALTTIIALFSGWILVKPALIAVGKAILDIKLATLGLMAAWLIIPAALALIFEDIYTYFQGGDSLLGDLAGNFPVLKMFLDDIGNWLKEHESDIQYFAFLFYELSVKAIDGFMVMGQYLGAFFEWLMGIFLDVGLLFTSVVDTWSVLISDFVVYLYNSFLEVVDIVTSLWQGFWDGLYNIVSTVVNSIATFILETIPNAIKSAFSSMGDFIAKMGGFFLNGEAQSANFNPAINPLPSMALAGGSNTFNNQNIVNVAGTSATPSQIKNAVISGNNQNVRTQLASVSRNQPRVLR